MTRICANPACGNVLVRHPTEGRGKFRERKTCSKPCNGALIRIRALERMAAMEPRHCSSPACGALLVPHPNEAPSDFAVRRSCGLACAAALLNVARRANGQFRRSPTQAAVEEYSLKTRPWPRLNDYRYHDRPGLDGWSG